MPSLWANVSCDIQRGEKGARHNTWHSCLREDDGSSGFQFGDQRCVFAGDVVFCDDGAISGGEALGVGLVFDDDWDAV